MTQKNKNTLPTPNIISKHVYDNFLFFFTWGIYLPCKTAYSHLLIFLFGILLPTQQNSTRTFSKLIPGSPDVSNLNKSLHQYGSLYQDMYHKSIHTALSWCLSRPEVYPGTPIMISIDETFIEKDKEQKSLPFVYYCGHKKRYGFYVVVIHIQIGKYHYHGGYRLYDPKRPETKQTLALEMLRDLYSLFQGYTQVTVLTDSAYPEEKLMKYVIASCGWRWVGAIKRNRCMDKKSVQTRFRYISNQRYRFCTMYKRRYLSTSLQGHLSKFSEPGLFIVTKTKKMKSTPTSWRYYYCSDLSMTVQEVLSLYENRWRIENDFWTLKEPLSMSKFRYRKPEAVKTYLSLVFLTYNWLNHCKNQEMIRVKQKNVPYGVGDMLVKIRSTIQSYFVHGKAGSISNLVDEFWDAQLQMKKAG